MSMIQALAKVNLCFGYSQITETCVCAVTRDERCLPFSTVPIELVLIVDQITGFITLFKKITYEHM